MSRLLKLVAAGILSVSGMAVVGCEGDPDVELPPRTEGERLRLQAARTHEKADMMIRAEKMISEGQGKKAEGQALKEQGRTVEGEKLEAEGEGLIRQGEALKTRAEQMETQVELETSSTAKEAEKDEPRPAQP